MTGACRTDELVARVPPRFSLEIRENESEAEQRANAIRPLTHSLDLTEERLAMNATRSCSTDGCERPVRCKGLCRIHYDRMLRNGTLHKLPSPKIIDLTGQRFGRWTVVRRADPPSDAGGRARWHCVCDCGGEGDVKAGNLKRGASTSCGCRAKKVSHDLLSRDMVSYKGAHKRIFRVKGAASAFRCADCGEQARDWSYDGLDPNQLVGGRTGNLRYSLDADRYVPRCKPCHSAFDIAARDGR